MAVLNTDNVAILAVLSLDVRPSSICVIRVAAGKFEVQVLRHEIIGRSFEFYCQRFAGILQERFKGTDLGGLDFDIVVVDELEYKFEAQKAWDIATNPIKVSP